jgi:hypothetical protein
MWAQKKRGKLTSITERLRLCLRSRSLTGVLLPVGGRRSSCVGPKDSGAVGLTGVLLTTVREGMSVFRLGV